MRSVSIMLVVRLVQQFDNLHETVVVRGAVANVLSGQKPNATAIDPVRDPERSHCLLCQPFVCKSSKLILMITRQKETARYTVQYFDLSQPNEEVALRRE